ncbi:hypothetical protein BDL97_08G075000 [Sphagnum fallax]|jgi:hypothetical protein|nr:hypothetical protein BDL97_08G075000 [Sphagnum fallax]
MSLAVADKGGEVVLENRSGDLGRDAGYAEPSGVHFGEDAGDNSSTCEALERLALEGLVYTLPYVGVQELLVLERVSKSLWDAIRSDALLWQRVRVDAPLSTKLTDTGLLKLVERAHGRLRSLSLIQCQKVSDEAIETVLATNPTLSKLSIPGCTNISAEGLTRMVTNHNSAARSTTNVQPGLKQLRIEGLYGLNKEILEALQTSLNTEAPILEALRTSLDTSEAFSSATKSEQPWYYRSKQGSFSSDENDDRAIDVAACPKCDFVRPVYDCPGESCQELRANPLRQCRGCLFCIPRCADCGSCVTDSQEDTLDDTFCGDLLCSSCWLRLPKCAECNRPGCSHHHHANPLRNSNWGPNWGPTGYEFEDNSIHHSRPKDIFVCFECSSSIPRFED